MFRNFPALYRFIHITCWTCVGASKLDHRKITSRVFTTHMKINSKNFLGFSFLHFTFHMKNAFYIKAENGMEKRTLIKFSVGRRGFERQKERKKIKNGNILQRQRIIFFFVRSFDGKFSLLLSVDFIMFPLNMLQVNAPLFVRHSISDCHFISLYVKFNSGSGKRKDSMVPIWLLRPQRI